MTKTTDNKPRLVLNEDTMTLVNLTGYHVINKQIGVIKGGLNGFRVTAHFTNSTAVLAVYSDEAHADECLKALIHYILYGQDAMSEDAVSEGDKDVFKVRSIIKESNIIIPSSAEAQT